MKIRRPIFLAGLGIVAGALTAYHNTFTAPFVFDDEPSILYNPSITQLWPLWQPLSPPGGFGLTVSGRPLLNLTLALNYAISGTNPWSYHVFNLVIHALAGLALFGVVRRTLMRPVLAKRFEGRSLPAAFAIALLWTLHPLQTESVTYTVQRCESLMGLFYLFTLYAFIRSVEGGPPDDAIARKRGGGWRAVAVVACLLGMMCKEVMVTAPVLVLLYDRTFVSGSFSGVWRNRRWFHGAMALTLLPLVWLVLHSSGNRGGTFVFTVTGFRDYWMTQFGAITHYLRLTFWPHPLILDYGTFWIRDLSVVFMDAAVVFGLLGWSLWLLWWRPVAGFLAAFFWLILAPTSLLPGTIQMIVEHRMYLSLAAVLALVVGGAVARYGRPAAWGFVALAIIAGGLTERRNADYASDFTLWNDNVKNRPSSAKAQMNLGTAYYRRGGYAEALALYQEAMRLDPTPQTDFNLGLAFDKLGRIDEATPHYEAAIRALPYYAQAHAMLGAAFARQGRLPEARDHLTTALHYNPDMPETYYRLGIVMAETGHPTEALGCYEEALRRQPGFAEPECGIGVLLYHEGRAREAQEHLERALKFNPRLADAHYNLGLILAADGRSNEAMAHYAEAIRFAPTLVEARLNWGIALAQSRHFPEALVQLQEAVRLKPALAEARGNLGIVFSEMDRVTEAVTQYEEALRLRPDYGIMHYNLGNALLQLQHWEGARRHFAEAVRLMPDFAPAKEMLQQLQTLPAGR